MQQRRSRVGRHALRARRVLALPSMVLTVALVVSGSLALADAGSAADPHAAAQTSSPTQKPKGGGSGNNGSRTVFTPRTGVITSDPRNASRGVVVANIIKAINNTPRGQQIRILTWNLASRNFVNRLLFANHRGVSVRLIMSAGKANEQPRSSGDFWRLKRGLRTPSPDHPQAKGQHSWAHACDGSCRGTRGIAHTKSFIFSRVGKADDVVMSTSANATEVSTHFQWNDLFTLVGNARIYDKFDNIFKQSAMDTAAHPAYQTEDAETVSAYFYPWKGMTARGDRVLNELGRVQCKGTRDGAGINGRTSIHVAQDAIIDDRGIRIAKRLRTMYEHGCYIKIVYSLMGNQILDILRHTSRGPVPIQQIVRDTNADGVYDYYLHSKVMTLSGRYGKDRSAQIAWQGSENWSGLALISDEQGLKITRDNVTRQYSNWIDRLYGNPPAKYSRPMARVAGRRVAASQARGVDPYANIRANL